jgi:DNA polymerase-1
MRTRWCPEGGFDLEAARLEPGELAGWLAEHAAGERTGVDIIGHWGSGTGDITALSLAAADGAAAYVAVAEPRR